MLGNRRMRGKDKTVQRVDLGSTPESAFQTLPNGRVLTNTGRVMHPVQFPQGGYSLTRPMQDRYDVQAFTGYSTATVPGGQWIRGQIVRWNQPKFRMPRENAMVDPTAPETWNTAEF